MVTPRRAAALSAPRERHYLLVIVIVVLTLGGILGTGLYLDYRRNQQNVETLDQLLTAHTVAWRAVQNQYEITLQTYYEELLYSSRMAELFADALQEASRLDARVGLYRTLYPRYEMLRDRGIRTLELVLPGGEVLLRFHRPDRYGDRIAVLPGRSDDSPQEPVSPRDYRFTVGRTLSGFRYSFPVRLTHEGVEVVGYVTLGIPFEIVRREMSRLLPDHDFELLLQREIVEEVLFEDQQRLYGTWPGSDAYLIEDPHRILPGSPPPLRPESDEVVAVAAKDAAVKSALRSGAHAALPVTVAGNSYSIILIAIRDVSERHVGFVASYTAMPALDRAGQAFLIGLLLTAAFISLFGITAYRLLGTLAQRLHERRRLQTINDTLGEGLYVMDQFGLITEINRRATELLGYAREELLGCQAHSMFHSHDANNQLPLQECPIFRTVMNGEEFEGEEEFSQSDGGLIPVRVISRPILENGEITGSVTSFSDLSDQRRTLDWLRTLSIAVEQSPESIMITDRAGDIEYVNASFVTTTGYQASEVLGKNPRILKSGRTASSVFTDMWHRLSAGESWRGELVNRRKNGREYHEEAIVSPIVTDGGETVGFLAIKQDISDRKRNEQELKNRLAENEILLKEVHHRVRNNLNVIASLLNLQSTAISTPDDAVTAFAKTNDRVTSMAMVHDTLHRSDDFSRLDSENYVAQLIAHLQQVYQIGSRISVSYSVCRACLRAEIGVPCGLILTELISNAFQYAFPDGRSGRLHVGLERIGGDNGQDQAVPVIQRLSVIDDGVGYDQSLDAARGLGLTLVHMLTEQIAGELTTETSAGTRVTIDFPG